MPYNEIAKKLDVSEGTVRNRVNGLRENRQLRIAAMVDPVADEYKTKAMIGIKVAPRHTAKEVGNRLGANEMVVFVLWIAGKFDLMIEVVTDDEDEFQDFLEQQIYAASDVADWDVMLGLKTIKNQYLLKRHWGEGKL